MTFDVGMVSTHVSPAKGYGGVAVSAARLAAAWARVPYRRILVCASNASEKSTIKTKEVVLGNNVKVDLYHAWLFKRWGFGFGAIARLLRV